MGNHIILSYLQQHPEIGVSELENLYVYFKFKAYLQTTLRCTRKAYLIKEGNLNQTLCYFEPEELCRLSDAQILPGGDDVQHDLEWAVRQLEPRQAEVIRLYFYDGKTDLEIAQMRHVSRQAVNGLKRRALRTLREFLISYV